MKCIGKEKGMRFFVVVLFVLTGFVPMAYAQEECPESQIISDSVEAEVCKLDPKDRAVVDKIKDVLSRANEKELDRLRTKIKNDPAWKIANETQRAFWQEVINIAFIHLWQDDCLTLYLMLGYYSRANHTKVDEECARNIERLVSTLIDTKSPFPSPHEDCRKDDPVAVARFDQALAYFYIVYRVKYKCHCDTEGY
jgi:hypothetical protein